MIALLPLATKSGLLVYTGGIFLSFAMNIFCLDDWADFLNLPTLNLREQCNDD